MTETGGLGPVSDIAVNKSQKGKRDMDRAEAQPMVGFACEGRGGGL
jgi:hypothetical protein